MPITGRCNCGSVAFEIEAEVPPQLTRSKRGHLYAYCAPAHLRVLTGSAATATYRWKLKAHRPSLLSDLRRRRLE
jgi:hypothetical protein